MPTAPHATPAAHAADALALPRLLVWLRYLAVAGQATALLVAEHALHLMLPWSGLWAVVLWLLAANLALHAALAAGRLGTSPWAVAAQLLLDQLAFTALLYFSGGPGNPFISLYLVPIALASLLPRQGPLWVLAGVTAALYTALMAFNVPLRHHHGDADFDLHVTGMWVNFLLTTGLLVAFLGRAARLLRARDRHLAEQRERQLRDESVLGLGTLAAGTAHELNTPLNTLGLLVEEWKAAGAPPDPEDLALFERELARCRTHVRTLADLARAPAGLAAAARPADALLREVAHQWQLLRPSVAFELALAPGLQMAALPGDPTLGQAIVNLLNNAADASEAAARGGGEAAPEVQLHAALDDARDAGRDAPRVVLRILDRGPGPAGIARGERSPGGLGIGLLISNATLERLGGDVRQFARAGGGCETRATLPAAPLAPGHDDETAR